MAQKCRFPQETNVSGTTGGDYSWKHWRGAAWNRSSVGVGWRKSRYSGWGIFEAMDMTAAMGAGSETNRETPAFCSAVHCLFLSEEKRRSFAKTGSGQT
jgi:hypothetical protein